MREERLCLRNSGKMIPIGGIVVSANSIKELEIGDDYSTNEVIKLNNMVDIQKLPTKAYKNSSFCVFSRNLYKGTKYDDTCIAELNLCFKKFGWLFGE